MTFPSNPYNHLMPEGLESYRSFLETHGRELSEISAVTYAPSGQPGVYAIWTSLSEQVPRCLYVGSSNDLQRRLIEHIRYEENQLLFHYVYVYGSALLFTFETTPTETVARDREYQVIRRLIPECNNA